MSKETSLIKLTLQLNLIQNYSIKVSEK